MATFWTRMNTVLLLLIALALMAVIGMLATGASGGPLDPPKPVSPTLRSLGDVPPSWHRALTSTDGDASGCNSTRFTCVMGGDAVLDNETGLVWQRQPSMDVDYWNYKIGICDRGTNTGGRFGWRLPALREIASLIDLSADYLPTGHPFLDVTPDLTAQYFWTMTTHEMQPDLAYIVVLDPMSSYGTIPAFGAAKNVSNGRAWCVRGGIGYDGSGQTTAVP